MLTKKSLIALLLALGLCSACSGKKQETLTVVAPPPAAPSVGAESQKTAPVRTVTANFSTPSEAVKAFFDAVSKEQFDVAWTSMTKTSQDKLISMVATDEKMDASKVRTLFEENQTPIRVGFWKSFRNTSRIETLAPTAVYKVLNEGPEQAEVEMSSGEIVLKCKAFKEGGQWRMGYVETFLP